MNQVRMFEVSSLTLHSIVEHTIGVICSCMPACHLAMRRSFPLLIKYNINRITQLRKLGARIVFNARSRARFLFGPSGIELSSSNNQDVRNKSNSQKEILGNLPEVPQNAYRMTTARAFIWGSKGHDSIPMDETRNETSFLFV